MLVQNEEKKMLIESMKKLTLYKLYDEGMLLATLKGKKRYSMRFLCMISIRSSLIWEMKMNVRLVKVDLRRISALFLC